MGVKLLALVILGGIILAGPAMAGSDVGFMPVCPPKNCASCGDLAYKLSFDLPQSSGKFEATIWGKAMEAFREGKGFELDSQTGSSHIISQSVVTDVKAKFTAPTRSVVEGGKWSVSFPVSSGAEGVLSYAISPVIPMLQPFCE